MSQGRLQGKVAVVTGGGGGFGKGIAAEFVKQGASVIIADFVEEVGQKTSDELKCEFVRADVTKREDWEKLVKFADEKFGKLDVVVNNAGTTYRNKVRANETSHSVSHEQDTDLASLRLYSQPTKSQTKTSTRSSQSTCDRSTTPRTSWCHICKRRATAVASSPSLQQQVSGLGPV